MATTSSSQENFVAAATDHGLFTIAGDSKNCNKAYDRVIAAARILKESKDGGEAILIDLLSYPDDSVKSWAAAYLLRFRPEEAMKTLEDVASRPGLVAFSAGVTLREWRAGRLELA